LLISPIKELREIDANQSSLDTIARIFGEKWRLVDVKSRRVFMSGATLGALKYIVGFNHYSSRHKKINSDLALSKCPRYDYCETWEHVIQYEVLECNNEAFLIKLQSKLEQEAQTNEEKDAIDSVMSDVRCYLIGNENKCLTKISYTIKAI